MRRRLGHGSAQGAGEGNFVFSPSSIVTALAMTYAGAEGNTAAEMAEALRCRVRYFTDGMALGSAEFLKQLQADYGEWFPEQRKTGSAIMKGADWGELRVIRNLRVSPLA